MAGSRVSYRAASRYGCTLPTQAWTGRGRPSGWPRFQLAVAVGVDERLVAVTEVPRGVAATPEDCRPQVLAGHEPGGQVNAARAAVPGSSSRLTACSQASWVAWRMVNRKLRRWSTWRSEAAAQGRLRRPAVPAGRLPALVVQPDLGGRRRVVEGRAATLTRYQPRGDQVDLARRRRPSGWSGWRRWLVGLGVVGRLEAADQVGAGGRWPGSRRGRPGPAAPSAGRREPHPDRQAVVLGLDRPAAPRLVEPVQEGRAGDGRVEGGRGSGRDRSRPQRVDAPRRSTTATTEPPTMVVTRSRRPAAAPPSGATAPGPQAARAPGS